MAIGDRHVSTGSITAGYPCPYDETELTLLPGGAWCPECHTVWRQGDEVSLADLDALEGDSDG